MLLIDKLKKQSNFTDAEIVLSNYILANLNDVSKMTIYELSENSFCSVATISRFCKKLKLKNFNQLKINIVKELSNLANNTQRIENNYPFLPNDSEEVVAQKIHHLAIQTINENYAAIDYMMVHHAALLLNNAEIIDIYASWNSLVSAINLHSKLLWMGKNSNLEIGQGFQRVKSTLSNEKHVAVIISHYGTNERNICISKNLKKNNTPYILITGPNLNPLCVNAKVVLHIASEESNANKIAPFSSDIAMDFVINVLYSFMFRMNFDENIYNSYYHNYHINT